MLETRIIQRVSVGCLDAIYALLLFVVTCFFRFQG